MAIYPQIKNPDVFFSGQCSDFGGLIYNFYKIGVGRVG